MSHPQVTTAGDVYNSSNTPPQTDTRRTFIQVPEVRISNSGLIAFRCHHTCRPARLNRTKRNSNDRRMASADSKTDEGRSEVLPPTVLPWLSQPIRA